jgi:hypothetical protein
MEHGLGHIARRGVIDFLIALVIFSAVIFGLEGGRWDAGAAPWQPPLSYEQAAQIGAVAPAPTTAASLRTSRYALAEGFVSPTNQKRFTIILLGVVFSASVAFNLAFWRHLRRVYASPRRRSWRRG